jgi:1-deoxy-D-xylulose-5-phosphate synthase
MTESNTILNRINSPEDIRGLSTAELEALAAEIRQCIISVVSRNGGHLAANLGTVELTLALHSVFNTPKDKIIWDVGHQTYTHKLISGRRDKFETLRQFGGCSGFPAVCESEYDCFIAGHAGTAISAAIGMKAAAEHQGNHEQVVAVVGDGSFNCGISLEGMNNAKSGCRGLVVVLNDNKMSISPNVGAMARHLNHLISAAGYIRFRASIKDLFLRFRSGKGLYRFSSRLLRSFKTLILPGSVFEAMGFRYMGPINGHDIDALKRTLKAAQNSVKPVLVHVLTGKGRGYQPAENAPEKFHGLSSFNPDTGEAPEQNHTTFSQAFGNALCELAERRDHVVAITAAMSAGTGLACFSKKFPRRFYDVGIAEEHAVVFAAGLASGGMRPVVAIYATFMQRALDCLFHDVCLQNIPVILGIDRAGIVEDGPTHHGIHDLGFMRTMPNLTIMAPADKHELSSMLEFAYELASPVVIRYPRGSAEPVPGLQNSPLEHGKAQVLRDGVDLALWAWGRETKTALEVAEKLNALGMSVTVVNTRFLKPFDVELLRKHAATMPIFTLEDNQTGGGLGVTVDEELINFQHCGVKHFGWGIQVLQHGAVGLLRQENGFTVDYISEAAIEIIKNSKK